MIRCTADFSGHVQGVGFRFTTCRLASAYPAITGWVRNEQDGSVRLVVEAERDQIEDFLVIIRDRLAGNIQEVHLDWQQATGEFGGFGVRY